MKFPFASLICAATILGSTLYALPYESELKHLGPDTIEYLEYSDRMLSGSLLNDDPIRELPKGSIVRGPGFPALLSAGRLLFPDDLRAALLCVHAFLGFASGMFVCVVFRRYVPAWASALILSILFINMRPWFNGICTEWSTFTLSIAFLGGALLFFESPSPRRLVAWTTVATLLPAVRPNFTLAWIVPLMALLTIPRGKRAKHIYALLLGLWPLFILLLLNYCRLHIVSLTPYGGRNLFIAGIMSGTSNTRPNDENTLVRFIELVNQRKHTFSQSALSLTEGTSGFEQHIERYLEDFYLAENIASEIGLDHLQLNRYAAIYAKRAILAHFSDYVALQLRWYTWLAKKMAYVVPTLVLVGIWLRRRQNCPLAFTFLSLLILQLIQMASVITTQPPLERYLITTHYTLVYVTIIATWRYYSALIARPGE